MNIFLKKCSVMIFELDIFYQSIQSGFHISEQDGFVNFFQIHKDIHNVDDSYLHSSVLSSSFILF